MYVIQKISDRSNRIRYVAPGKDRIYVKDILDARAYPTKEAAERDCGANEYVKEVQ